VKDETKDSEKASYTTQTQEEKGISRLAGKYLTFKLDNEEYGIEILKVKEIIGMMDITKVPQMPSYIRGVINLRGKVIPVMDLRAKFGMKTKNDEQSCIIVVDIKHNTLSSIASILVDTVVDVLDISPDQIENSPSFGPGFDSKFIMGLAKDNQDVKILLNIEAVLL
jgi:purine-binding chemotaxis protein CheW